MSEYVQFIVLKRKGRWIVKTADLERVFGDPIEAMKQGIELANECGKNGKPSVVLIQKAKNRFETIWTYGEDLYPPAVGSLRAISDDRARGPQSRGPS